MARKNTASTTALSALRQAAIPHAVHSFDITSRDFGSEAGSVLQENLGVAPERVFKTLVVNLNVKSGKPELAVCCIPVTATLSLKKAAAAHGASKAIMADPKLAERSSGYVVGGISPIGQKHPLPTAIDSSATDHESIFVSAGRRGLDIEIATTDLVQATQAKLADLKA